MHLRRVTLFLCVHFFVVYYKGYICTSICPLLFCSFTSTSLLCIKGTVLHPAAGHLYTIAFVQIQAVFWYVMFLLQTAFKNPTLLNYQHLYIMLMK